METNSRYHYRPISLFSALSRVLEKLIFDKIYPVVLYTFCNSTKRFLQKTLNCHKFNRISSQLYISFDSPDTQYLIALYVDFQKAFDKVNHSLLLENLALIGIGGNCHRVVAVIWTAEGKLSEFRTLFHKNFPY